jgi:undecaprenyl-diphosphatase
MKTDDSVASKTAAGPAQIWFDRMAQMEIKFCLRVNRLSQRRLVRQGFRIISRLGDGVFWYGLMLLLPLTHGLVGIGVSVLMLITGIVGLLIYRFLKSHLVRERPFVAWSTDIQCGIPPLDEFSFPSGHTLHAAAFTTLLLVCMPVIGLLVLPFALLVAASRVVLGLHYPTDVFVGAVIGMGLAVLLMYALPGLVPA